MGSVYRPKGRKVWMIKYRSLDGRLRRESSKSTLKTVAQKLLRDRDHAKDQGVLVTPEVGKLTFAEAVAILVDYHKAQDRKTKKLEARIGKHLTPFFGPHRPMVTITGDLIMKYTVKRKADVRISPARTRKTRKGVITIPERQKPTQNATINRELAWLKHMFTLAVRSGKLLTRPHIELLPEHNARQGFFEDDQLQAVLRALPEEARAVVEFAAITGWRVKSEVLTREWRHVDFQRGEVKLDRYEAKNKEPRIFVMTAALRALLDKQHAEAERLKKRGKIVPWVFFRLVPLGQKGPLQPKPIKTVAKAFKSACVRAGCPGRILHDLRRTAVRRFVRHGIPERVAMQLTGHKTRSVFERYNIVSDGDLREAARKLDGTTAVISPLGSSR